MISRNTSDNRDYNISTASIFRNPHNQETEQGRLMTSRLQKMLNGIEYIHKLRCFSSAGEEEINA